MVVMATLSPAETALLEHMKKCSRDAYKLSAEAANDLADRIDSGELPAMDASSALRLLASMLIKGSV